MYIYIYTFRLFPCLGRVSQVVLVINVSLIPGWEDSLDGSMATHSSIFAWKIPWTEEPGRLQSTGLHRARYD